MFHIKYSGLQKVCVNFISMFSFWFLWRKINYTPSIIW